MEKESILKERNLEIIQNLEGEIKKIDIEDLEEKLKEVDLQFLEKKVWNTFNSYHLYINKIEKINLRILQKHNLLSEIHYLNNVICNVTFSYDPINQLNPFVQQFYREIEEKYADKPEKLLVWNWTQNPANRILKLEVLNKEEQKHAQVLNCYLRLFVLKKQFEKMVDCLECINFNFLEE